ncbi:mitotic checkpoint regulator, MAD2B-interacting-domain-containing protein [Kockovaella imperatae]|uniref:Mitotic checkpoint regulator, MAD2B-interacting-domain-containing protein n=1 Tax=Kockovaella imperatae TaxID=4999 RepID=A0A1Y1UAF8_9TREE|nr:mitotic checkpoint regulator, MAD2B-interacting-domain-containing protein [Kockovaella imperatae]ORX35020.1 mitotic checkpoint regulator, MAD2B-interacting-domain-containing protein [Kockovaella imperatae]
MLLANYGSDSGSDSESEAGPSKVVRNSQPAKVPVTVKASPAPSKPVVKGKSKGPIKITLDLPKANAIGGTDVEDEDDGLSRQRGRVSPDDEGREVKKPKIQGKGSSALLGMLPPPKRKILPKVEGKSSLSVNKSMAVNRPPPPPGMEDLDLSGFAKEDDGDAHGPAPKSGFLLPSSIARGKAKAEKEKEKAPEPVVDLFGLSEPSVSSSTPSIATTFLITSAPSVPDFVPPEPTLNDPYPGYYQLPSGQWAAYDEEYYTSFFSKEGGEKHRLQGDRREDDGQVGKHWDEYNSRGADVLEIDVAQGLAEGRAEQARLEQLQKPKTGDDFEYKGSVEKTKGLAAQRHQLTSLLSTAYSQRQELEDRIAANQKSMRAARSKYGF